MYIFINNVMKLTLIILTVLLVGCLASTTVKYEVEKYQVSQDIDKKIEQLKQEQEKLLELQKNIDKQLNERIRVTPPVAGPRPVPPPVMSLPPRFESDRISGAAGSAPPKVASIDAIGSGSMPTPAPLPKPILKLKNIPDNLTVAEQLYKANAVFGLPNKANINDEIKAQLIIDPVRTLEEIKKDITVGPVKEAEQIKIAKIVIAKLTAPDFDFISASSTEQAIVEDSKTEWFWVLRPKTSGIHPINLVIEAQVTVGNKTTPHFIRTFDKQVMIEITPVQLISTWWDKYWQWVFVTLLLPFIKWLYNKYTEKKKSIES